MNMQHTHMSDIIIQTIHIISNINNNNIKRKEINTYTYHVLFDVRILTCFEICCWIAYFLLFIFWILKKLVFLKKMIWFVCCLSCFLYVIYFCCYVWAGFLICFWISEKWILYFFDFFEMFVVGYVLCCWVCCCLMFFYCLFFVFVWIIVLHLFVCICLKRCFDFCVFWFFFDFSLIFFDKKNINIIILFFCFVGMLSFE